MTADTPRYYGKYRGTVVNNVDPQTIGRLMVIVPDVALTPSTWAMPCFPMAGKQMGVYAIPQIGSGVWVEFEQGDPDYPVWVGCWWGSAAEVPPMALIGVPGDPNIVIQSTLQNAIVISDLPGPTGGIMLKSATGLGTIIVNDTHILIQNGICSIEVTAAGVIVNSGALTVLP